MNGKSTALIFRQRGAAKGCKPPSENGPEVRPGARGVMAAVWLR